MNHIFALFVVASVLTATAATAGNDAACMKCVTRSCKEQATACVNEEGCPALVKCITMCIGQSDSDECVSRCTADTTPAADITAVNVLRCKVKSCPKDCYNSKK